MFFSSLTFQSMAGSRAEHGDHASKGFLEDWESLYIVLERGGGSYHAYSGAIKPGGEEG